jgi:hypothetical protein
MLAGLAGTGVTELVVVAAPPADPAEAPAWITSLAGRWIPTAGP